MNSFQDRIEKQKPIPFYEKESPLRPLSWNSRDSLKCFPNTFDFIPGDEGINESFSSYGFLILFAVIAFAFQHIPYIHSIFWNYYYPLPDFSINHFAKFKTLYSLNEGGIYPFHILFSTFCLLIFLQFFIIEKKAVKRSLLFIIAIILSPFFSYVMTDFGASVQMIFSVLCTSSSFFITRSPFGSPKWIITFIIGFITLLFGVLNEFEFSVFIILLIVSILSSLLSLKNENENLKIYIISGILTITFVIFGFILFFPSSLFKQYFSFPQVSSLKTPTSLVLSTIIKNDLTGSITFSIFFILFAIANNKLTRGDSAYLLGLILTSIACLNFPISSLYNSHFGWNFVFNVLVIVSSGFAVIHITFSFVDYIILLYIVSSMILPNFWNGIVSHFSFLI